MQTRHFKFFPFSNSRLYQSIKKVVLKRIEIKSNNSFINNTFSNCMKIITQIIYNLLLAVHINTIFFLFLHIFTKLLLQQFYRIIFQ